MTTPSYVPANSVTVLFSPYSHDHLPFLGFLFWPFRQVWGVISLLFWFVFPWWILMLRTFHVSICHLYVFFTKMSPGTLPISNWIICFFGVELHKFFPYFLILIPYQIYHLQISSFIQKIVFLFCWWFPLLCKTFLFWCSSNDLFLYLFPLPQETYLEKILLQPMAEKLLHMF